MISHNRACRPTAVTSLTDTAASRDVDDGRQKSELARLDKESPAPIRIFTWPPGEKPRGWSEEADVLFVFSGFAGVTPLKKEAR